MQILICFRRTYKLFYCFSIVKSRLLSVLCLSHTNRVCFGRISGKEIKKLGYSMKGRRLYLPHGKQSYSVEDLIPKSSSLYFGLPSVSAVLRRDVGMTARVLCQLVIPHCLIAFKKKKKKERKDSEPLSTLLRIWNWLHSTSGWSNWKSDFQLTELSLCPTLRFMLSWPPCSIA